MSYLIRGLATYGSPSESLDEKIPFQFGDLFSGEEKRDPVATLSSGWFLASKGIEPFVRGGDDEPLHFGSNVWLDIGATPANGEPWNSVPHINAGKIDSIALLTESEEEFIGDYTDWSSYNRISVAIRGLRRQGKPSSRIDRLSLEVVEGALDDNGDPVLLADGDTSGRAVVIPDGAGNFRYAVDGEFDEQGDPVFVNASQVTPLTKTYRSRSVSIAAGDTTTVSFPKEDLMGLFDASAPDWTNVKRFVLRIERVDRQQRSDDDMEYVLEHMVLHKGTAAELASCPDLTLTDADGGSWRTIPAALNHKVAYDVGAYGNGGLLLSSSRDLDWTHDRAEWMGAYRKLGAGCAMRSISFAVGKPGALSTRGILQVGLSSGGNQWRLSQLIPVISEGSRTVVLDVLQDFTPIGTNPALTAHTQVDTISFQFFPIEPGHAAIEIENLRFGMVSGGTTQPLPAFTEMSFDQYEKWLRSGGTDAETLRAIGFEFWGLSDWLDESLLRSPGLASWVAGGEKSDPSPVSWNTLIWPQSDTAFALPSEPYGLISLTNSGTASVNVEIITELYSMEHDPGLGLYPWREVLLETRTDDHELKASATPIPIRIPTYRVGIAKRV